MKNYLLAIFLFIISLNIKSQCAITTAPTEDCTYGDQITSYVLNSIAATGNAGCGANGYNSFATPVWTLQQGSTYAYSAATGSGIYLEAFAIWIDLNNNSIYEASEQLATDGSNLTHSGNITIPNTALAGPNRRMRIRCCYGNTTVNSLSIAATDACVSGLGLGYGETEDYYVTISCNPVANPAPTTLNASVSSSSVCAGTSATLTAAGATYYSWTPGTLTGTTVVVSPTATTIYTLQGDNGGCAGTKTISLVVNQGPALIVTPSAASICVGSSATLTASGATSYSWSQGGSTSPVLIVTPSVSTLYNVTGTNAIGCSTTVSQVIIAMFSPTITTTTNKPLICAGSPATLFASGAGTYSWVNGPTTNTWVVTPTVSTTYTAIGLNSTNPCPDTRTVTVTVFTPSITVSGPTTICNGSSVNITVTGASTYSLSPAVIVPSVSTLYYVYTITSSLSVVCPKKDSIQVNVNPSPTITAVAERTFMCVKETNTLTASGAVTYTWSNNTTNATIVLTPTSTTPTNYTVTGTDNNGCTSSTVIVLKATNCTGISEQDNYNDNKILIYPNPNTGEFTIQSSSGIKLTLANELGQVIKTLELSAQNNYNVSVSNLANGIYFISGQNQELKINRKIMVSR